MSWLKETNTYSLLKLIRNSTASSLKYSAMTYTKDGIRSTITNPDDGLDYEISIRPMSVIKSD